MRLNFNEPNLLGEAIVYRTESDSRPGLFHYTFKLRYGGVVCTCEGWQFTGHCRHVNNVALDAPAAQEILRGWRADPNKDKPGRVAPHEGT